MKLALFIIAAGAIAYGERVYFSHPIIAQRLVHIIEIGPDHPPKYYDLLEDVKE